MDAPVIEFKADQAIAAMQRWPNRTQRATMRALNRALGTGRSAMAKAIAQDMRVSQKAARTQIWTVEATESRLEVRLQASLRRVALIKLGAKGLEPSRGRGTGVRHKAGGDVVVRVSKGAYRPATMARTFIATMPKSRHRGVFQREGKTRLKIHEVFGPSYGAVFNRHRSRVVEVMAVAFEKRLEHELKFASTEAARA
jgi:hypothetical protein